MGFLEVKAQGLGRHPGIVCFTKDMAVGILAGCVVRVGEGGQEELLVLLAYFSHGHATRRAARHHVHPLIDELLDVFDRYLRVRLAVGDEVADLASENATLLVDFLLGHRIGVELVLSLQYIRAAKGYVETDDDFIVREGEGAGGE